MKKGNKVNKVKKRNKYVYTSYILASVGFLMCAVVCFTFEIYTMALINLGLGLLFLGLTNSYQKKHKKNNKIEDANGNDNAIETLNQNPVQNKNK